MSKIDSFFNLSPLNTTVSRKVISFSDISTNEDIRSVGPSQPEMMGLPTSLGLWIFVSVITICRTICNGNRTEWSPIRSVIIRVITKSDDREAGVRFVYHEYDYRPNWTTRSPIAN